MFNGAGRVEVVADAPDFEAVAQVELDGRVVDVLRLQHNSPAATLARPIVGAVEQQRTDAVATKLAAHQDMLNGGNRAPAFIVEQDHSSNLPIGQSYVAAVNAAQRPLDIGRRIGKFTIIFIERAVKLRLAQLE